MFHSDPRLPSPVVGDSILAGRHSRAMSEPISLNLDLITLPWPDDSTTVFRAGEPSRNLAWIPQPDCWHAASSRGASSLSGFLPKFRAGPDQSRECRVNLRI
jgi:hypothetical protein